MAKTLLFIFVIAQVINMVFVISAKGRADWQDILPLWSAISVLAICESIEKSKTGE
ncbi:hypothetical protein [Rummeliibacillus sp. TYF-LIM-RU47]|uniref:hypothetical protein n=1 Tax=Rummeliibacillus sp. TYF-LIM-RU47 TaxID=2608406 RepID=UPI001680876B|nr:hypothetical protein [Rummeliibacillus sp. TYF-LIM-RU47]